ncbi:MAG: hypothetical protein LIR50_20975 [Bacillota bacterium]|nr:hypothetical protein [Bacillota bacterium]
MSSEVSDSANESIQTYIGIESEPEEGGPSICVEFDISLNIFIIAYALSLCEKQNSNNP